MSASFDIRDYVKNGSESKFQPVFDEINFMVFTLEGVAFKDTFTLPYAKLLGALRPVVQEAVGQFGVTQEKADKICASAEKLAECVGELMLKDMYITENSKLPAGVLEHSTAMRDAGAFVSYVGQTDEQKVLAKAAFDEGLLNGLTEAMPGIGELTEKEYYLTPAKENPGVIPVIQKAKAANILTDATTDEGEKANDYACDVNECVAYTGLFCSMVEGQCSIASDPYPG
jgi:hypothetical protein